MFFSALFYYLCYGSILIINILILSILGPSLYVRIWRPRQILTYQDGPSIERVNKLSIYHEQFYHSFFIWVETFLKSYMALLAPQGFPDSAIRGEIYVRPRAAGHAMWLM